MSDSVGAERFLRYRLPLSAYSVYWPFTGVKGIGPDGLLRLRLRNFFSRASSNGECW